MDDIVTVNNVRKTFGKVTAVSGVSFSVNKGELFGIIGPDGAGKTTLLRILVTLLRPDSGEMRVGGYGIATDIRHIRSIVGYMPQRFSLYRDLSIDQNLNFFADLFNVPKEQAAARKRRLYEFSRLEPFRKRLAGHLSGGMKQKLALSCTLIHDPVLLVLDEPTTGVDPVSRTDFWHILHELRQQGVSIIVSTPYMDEALLCDRVIVMHNGSLLGEGVPYNMITEHPYPVFALSAGIRGLTSEILEAFDGVLSVHSFGDYLHVSCKIGYTAESLQHNISRHTGMDISVDHITPTFEDVFISLIVESTIHAG